MGTLYGWWRSSPNTLTFYQCLLPKDCVGGRNSTCGPNRKGPICAVCEPGFAEALGSVRIVSVLVCAG
jgi:hypothetical protein